VDFLPHNPEGHDDIAGKALIAAWLQTGSTYHIMKHIVRGNNVLKHVYYCPGAALLAPKTMTNVLHSLKRLNDVEIKVDTTAVILQGDAEGEARHARASSSAMGSVSYDDYDAAFLNTTLREINEFSEASPRTNGGSDPAPPTERETKVQTPFLKRFISEGR